MTTMASSLRITELAAVIRRHVHSITSVQASPNSSEFGIHGQDQSEHVTDSKIAIYDAVDELQMLIRGPVEYLMDMVVNQVKVSWEWFVGVAS